jgi:cell division protein FtsQ
MSWLKQKNRRSYRYDVKGFDSKVRTKLRAQRHSKIAAYIAIGALAVTIVSAGVWFGLRAVGKQMFWENPHYQISEVRVENPGGTLKPEKVFAYLHLRKGMNLLNLDLGHLRSELELHPVVERAEFSRELPSRLVIRITERVPVANLITQFKGKLYQLDRTGVVMDLVSYQKDNDEVRKRLDALPEVMGVDFSDVKVGRPLTVAEVYSAIALMMKLNQTGFPLDVSSIDVSRKDTLLVKTLDNLAVRFSVVDFEKQLKRLSVIMDDAEQRSVRLATIDLSIPGNDVPVTRIAAINP